MPLKQRFREESEYLAVTPFGVKSYFILRYDKLIQGNSILRQKYLGGKLYRGRPSGGALPIFSFRFPFLSSEVSKYYFCQEQEEPNTIFFYPRQLKGDIYLGKLYLTLHKIPRKLVMVPLKRFPRLQYAIKEAYFEIIEGRLVEVFTEVTGKLSTLPLYPTRILYRIKKTQIKIRNPVWEHP